MSDQEYRKPNYRAAKNRALEILLEFKIAQPPVNPVQIARDLDISVYFSEFKDTLKDVSGFYYAKNDSIYVNSAESPLRQTFTIAHELGHRLLHLEWANSSEYKVLLRDQAASSKNPFEQEANTFAANLLVPRFMLDEYYKVANPRELSRLFAVSVSVIENRIKFEYGDV